METTQTSTIASIDSRSGWRKTDTMWMLGLYGTAIGAGVLFLPINAGVGGMIPLIIMAIIAFPMTFFAHRGLTRFVLSGKNPGEDITEVVEEHFGIGAGKLITLLYFLPDSAGLQCGDYQHRGKLHDPPVGHHPAAARDSVSDPDCRHDDHRALR
ncbi:serine transporter [Citrobacter koseri]|uniref:Serine transporter n=1 Tax=Citrobacter koseri TaxID=545 RepID=A0A078LFS4_CITKO|nr:serine transporter [Citrobacter koseri]